MRSVCVCLRDPSPEPDRDSCSAPELQCRPPLRRCQFGNSYAVYAQLTGAPAAFERTVSAIDHCNLAPDTTYGGYF